FHLAQLNGNPATVLSNLDTATAYELGLQLWANARVVTNWTDRIFWSEPTMETVAAFDFLRDFPVLSLSTGLPQKIVLSSMHWSVAATSRDTGTELDPIIWPDDNAEPETPLERIA